MTNFRDLRPGRRLLAAVAAVAGLSLAHAPAAEAQNLCSTALSVNPAFCKGGSPAGCVPSAITDGMDVSLSVTVTNNSQFQGGGLPDPPSGNLEAGDTMVVYYACSNSVCGPTEVLAGYFTYVSHTALSGISFSDNGDGYSGTITVDNSSVTWAQGDTTDRELVTIDLIGNQPPGTGVVFARAGKSPDQSGDILVNNDPNCIGVPQTGGGNGSTAAAFASIPEGELDSCDHPNKQIIKLKASGDLGKGRVAFPDDCDPSTESFDIGYDNLTGGAFSFGSIPAGALEKGGRCWNYRDKSAKSAGGIASLRICPVKSKPDKLCVNYKGYGDIESVLVSDDMQLQVTACGQDYKGPPEPAIWDVSTRKWILPRSVWIP